VHDTTWKEWTSSNNIYVKKELIFDFEAA